MKWVIQNSKTGEFIATEDTILTHKWAGKAGVYYVSEAVAQATIKEGQAQLPAEVPSGKFKGWLNQRFPDMTHAVAVAR